MFFAPALPPPVIAPVVLATLADTTTPGQDETSLSPSAQPLAKREPPFHYNLKVDLPITATMTVAWILGTVFGNELAPSSCHWCDPNGFDTAFRDALRWDDPKLAGKISDGLCYIGFPLLAIGWDASAVHRHGGGWRDFGLDMGIVGETAAAILLFGQIFRYAVGRERPDVHDLPPAGKLAEMPEANTSMASGHMSFMVGLTVAEGIVFTRRGYADTPYFWATGLTLSAVTAYLRIASDRHYMTDVIAGSAIGVGLGILVPMLHKNDRATGLAGATIIPVASSSFAGAALRWQQ